MIYSWENCKWPLWTWWLNLIEQYQHIMKRRRFSISKLLESGMYSNLDFYNSSLLIPKRKYKNSGECSQFWITHKNRWVLWAVIAWDPLIQNMQGIGKKNAIKMWEEVKKKNWSWEVCLIIWPVYYFNLKHKPTYSSSASHYVNIHQQCFFIPVRNPK